MILEVLLSVSGQCVGRTDEIGEICVLDGD